MRRQLWIFLGILAALILYTGLQVGRLLPRAPTAEVWTVTVIFFWLILGEQFLHRSNSPLIDSRWSLGLSWLGSISLGIWATFLPLALCFDLGNLMRRLAGFGRPRTVHQGTMALLDAAVAFTALGLGRTAAGPIVREVKVPIHGLVQGLQGLRIVQVSDLHIGSTLRKSYVARVVRMVLALKPDIIAITGDLADDSVEKLADHIRPLGDLTAPLGAYYVTGNHEYYCGAQQWISKARELGFFPLIDENRIMTRNGAKILIGGVADTAAPHFVADHRSDPRRAALSGENPAFKLLLAHRPDSCIEAEPAGFDLQISGHTHGGQFFPFNLFIRLFHRYYRGLNRHGRMWVYVNPGTGYWGPPSRLGVPAEITLLRLCAA